ncbi:hypothetical protein GGI25_003627 [Coemansia spiralis]|uniref:Uncharacterized protein n=2 Tax=Coemansia TaxID=4863 RepID=A0A9W8KXC9_9FUNG|nr:hypothetical protein BX070DRAFT_258622 [Coemansia spiralis]KAJ1996145.1 hypothetical protein EDC05_000035 [Coemansia umbellata]KAJ2626098.1 hypothetical protein GGI26_000182 [Coemansia sp. RSA 1358]KAJ2676240.1 hypothetical protein GGI25_003627 [Coemansia spiralis]
MLIIQASENNTPLLPMQFLLYAAVMLVVLPNFIGTQASKAPACTGSSSAGMDCSAIVSIVDGSNVVGGHTITDEYDEDSDECEDELSDSDSIDGDSDSEDDCDDGNKNNKCNSKEESDLSDDSSQSNIDNESSDSNEASSSSKSNYANPVLFNNEPILVCTKNADSSELGSEDIFYSGIYISDDYMSSDFVPNSLYIEKYTSSGWEIETITSETITFLTGSALDSDDELGGLDVDSFPGDESDGPSNEATSDSSSADHAHAQFEFSFANSSDDSSVFDN